MPALISPSVISKNIEKRGFFPAMAALPAIFLHQLYTILATEGIVKTNTWKIQQL